MPHIHRLPSSPRQPDRRRRGRRASGLGRQGAGRERARRAARRRISIADRARRQEADPRRRRRRRDGAGGCAAWRSSGMRRARSRSPRISPAIRTLGFRGEALPSIASVSHFVLRTRARGSANGHRDPRQRRRRSRRSARSARRKARASRSPTCSTTCRRGESSSSRTPPSVADLAPGDADGARLSGSRLHAHERRPQAARVLRRPRDSSERFFQLFGERPDLVRGEERGRRAVDSRLRRRARRAGPRARRAERLRQPPHRQGPHDRARDLEAYSVATIKERSPEVHLFIEIAPDRVDVNVHPTKAEVRFLEQSLVHEVLRRALGEALGQGRAPELQFTPLRPSTGRAASDVRFRAFLPARPVGSRWTPEHDVGLALLDRSAAGQSPAPVHRCGASPASAGITAADIRPMIPLGQFRDTFIIAVDDEGIAIIDQHVAHERVLFEQVMEKLTAGRLESQRLLTPILIELSPAQRQALAPHAGDARSLRDRDRGVRRRQPAPVGGAGAARAGGVRSGRAGARRDLEGLDRGARVEDALRRIAATMACHAAVKANYPLTLEKMRYILEELRRTAYSSVCPHGRPVVLACRGARSRRTFSGFETMPRTMVGADRQLAWIRYTLHAVEERKSWRCGIATGAGRTDPSGFGSLPWRGPIRTRLAATILKGRWPSGRPRSYPTSFRSFPLTACVS